MVSHLAERLHGAASNRDVTDAMGAVIADRLNEAGYPDPSTVRLAQLVTDGLPVEEVAVQMGMGARQVHRRCLNHFGLPPTVLRRIARLHRAAHWRALNPWATLADVAASAGFADQAHLARDCRSFTTTQARVALR